MRRRKVSGIKRLNRGAGTNASCLAPALLLLATLSLGLAAPGFAGEIIKSRTFDDLVKIALKDGEKTTLDSTAENLGLKGKTPTKVIYFEGNHTPDGFEHTFNVTLDSEKDAAKATGVVWVVTKTKEENGESHIEGYAYALSLSGELKAASGGAGIPGKTLRQAKLSLNKTVKARYKKEMDFWLKDSVGLAFDK